MPSLKSEGRKQSQAKAHLRGEYESTANNQRKATATALVPTPLYFEAMVAEVYTAPKIGVCSGVWLSIAVGLLR